ncbi:DNA-binding transcriptional LysR family regulator [Herbaspirillum sp. Sphag1AN]|nr:DNA-binding transcriptional LysR family regulator [Herbaspirillum sp. Sphag1AN]MBB3247890.1 DNA-binding transcriptional LysR family regulator [Herbaspirillum sp. Sphag64]
MGAQLFERLPTGMVLSPAGEVLASHARREHLERERVLSEIQESSTDGGRPISVASTEGVARNFLPHVMSEFREAYPKACFVLNVAVPKIVIGMVKDGDVDLGITFSTKPSEGVQVEYSARSQIHALMHRQHPLSKRKSLMLADLQPYPMALREEGSTQRQLVDLCCQMEGLRLNAVLTSNDSGSLQQFVMRSNAIALTSKVSEQYELQKNDLISIALLNAELRQRDVQLLTMAGRTLPFNIRRFVDLLAIKMAAMDKLSAPPER